MKKYLLVQPHSDDILFSAAHYLFNPEFEVQVLTVENDPVRIAEDEKLYDFLNIKFHHLNTNFHDDSYYAFYKKYKSMTNESGKKFIEEYYDKNIMERLERELGLFISNFSLKNSDYDIVSPLGVGHPFHDWVHRILVGYAPVKYFYREFPHSYKRKASEHLKEKEFLFTRTSICPVEDYHDIKWKLASKFYRSQSGLQFYEQGYIKKKLPEEVYELDLPF